MAHVIGLPSPSKGLVFWRGMVKGTSNMLSLTGENVILDMYMDWKEKLNADLLIKDIKLFLTTNCPSSYHSSDEERESYVRWHTASQHVKKFLLASVGNALERFNKPKPPAISDPKWFDEMTSKCHTSKTLQDCQHVYDYVLDMMHDFAKLGSLGGVIDSWTQMVMILDGLPDSYESVRVEMLLSLEPLSVPEIWLKLEEAQEGMNKEKKKPLVDMAENHASIGQKPSMEESSQGSSVQPRQGSNRVAKRKVI